MSSSSSRKDPLSHERISKSRAFSASILTFVTVVIFLELGYHLIWSAKVMINQPYGNFFNNLVYGPGSFLANVGLSTKLLRYLNKVLVEDKLEADYKKYI
ncbi:putative integral membrane protein [Candida parapsilosis]|mgnify:CR=1 FL=1|uniref:Uncharacterized protein n=2 Tax=Candida parapsilosis TaxID=5480 RepID=G8BHU4_CANPC|nr:uncharacterized protein CPAR2_400095 [Candida parapsilosis]KAF6046903.1 putative integral membrane protein [Candida parapsilosis]KAF6047298.1 putative integral membrane protein [Candida parapsilosis]KAF6050731.1 hypothetical protein FOB59_002977 [Candida parapsilosis]KAF6061850.1 putative integral membrane protein [Candida parapsilosis]KAI5906241.1 hypothetical protein K4G60_g5515 [Candida parapsilosis]